MSATRYGGRKVNDVLVTSNVPGRQETADAEAPAARLRQHRVTGYAALETSISSRLALVSSMRFTSRMLSRTSRTVVQLHAEFCARDG